MIPTPASIPRSGIGKDCPMARIPMKAIARHQVLEIPGGRKVGGGKAEACQHHQKEDPARPDGTTFMPSVAAVPDDGPE